MYHGRFRGLHYEAGFKYGQMLKKHGVIIKGSPTFTITDEMKDFAYISKKLDEISLAIDSLNLWVDKTAGEQGLNLELLNTEKEKLK